jgi:hypothetical protein
MAKLTKTDVFGGFLITKRMLDLFRRPTDPPEYTYLYLIPALLFAAGLIYASWTGKDGLVQAGYAVSTLLCIGALTGLSSQVSRHREVDHSAYVVRQLLVQATRSVSLVFSQVLWRPLSPSICRPKCSFKQE